MPAHTFAIVTAYNEAQRIEATLDALKRAFPGARLFVGDDGSTDATAQIARGCGAHVVRSERVIGKGAAATLAVEAALLAARTDTSTRTGTEQAVGSHADADADGDDATRRDGASRAAGRDAAVFLLCDGDLGESA